MSALRQFTISCDHCDARLVDHEGFDFWDTEDAAAEAAGAQSWEESDGEWLCLNCHSLTDAARDSAAEDLHALCAAIPGLTVHGVGIGDGVFYVYCRAKRNAQKLIPKTHEGHAVKYVLCAAMLGGAK